MGSSVSVHNQTRRLLRLATPLGPDVLVALEAQGEEVMSRGFSVAVIAASATHHELQPQDLIGKLATLSLVLPDNTLRHFNGYVSEFALLGRLQGGQRSSYRLLLRPWLHLLEKRTDCRIFQEMSVPDVLREVFAVLGDAARFTFNLSRPQPPHRYLTQYNESDANFVMRLLAMSGIGFVCEHEEAAHCIDFFDDPDALPDLTAPRELLLQSTTHAHDHLAAWTFQAALASGRFAQRTYSYKHPRQLREGTVSAPPAVQALVGATALERYRFSERYASAAVAMSDVEVWMRQESERHHFAHGHGSYRHLQPGRHFTVKQVPDGTWMHAGAEFTMTRTVFAADDIAGEPAFSVRFEALPRGEAMLPQGVQPVIAGLQTALVTGPAGSEIFTDPLGRIKARFHWDRPGRSTDDRASCWLRVMQAAAGPSFGAHFTPRVGQEVVVAFENGDPDRPFVLGSLYHTEHTPPYAERNGSRSGIRSRSTKGGAVDNCNELYFEDEIGKEELYLQAERDLNALIKHDESRRVGHDQRLDVVNDQLELVGNNASHSIQKRLLIQAGESIILKVGGSVVELTAGKIVVQSGVVDIDGGTVQIN